MSFGEDRTFREESERGRWLSKLTEEEEGESEEGKGESGKGEEGRHILYVVPSSVTFI